MLLNLTDHSEKPLILLIRADLASFRNGIKSRDDTSLLILKRR